MSDGIEYRVLVKAYGLRFIINVSGIAGKFNIIPLLTTVIDNDFLFFFLDQ